MMLTENSQSEEPWILTGSAIDEKILFDNLMASKSRNNLYAYYFTKMMLAYLFQEDTCILDYTKKCREYVDNVIATPIIGIFYFYESLIYLSASCKVNGAKRAIFLRKVRKNQRRLKDHADFAPMNYMHRYYLVEAEVAKVAQNTKAAIENFELALELAVKSIYINETALANERAGIFYLSLGSKNLASIYFTQAKLCYEAWGAYAKVKHLKMSYPEFITSKETATLRNFKNATLTTFHNSDIIDLISVVKASQAISSEIKYKNLIQNLMKVLTENAGAEKIILLKKEKERFLIEVEYWAGDNIVSFPTSSPSQPKYPEEMISFCARTKETLVESDARKGKFSTTPYMVEQQPKSTLCMPLLNQGILNRILYLENNLIPGAFTAERVKILNLLSSQIAISIENATLNNEIEEYQKELENKVIVKTKSIRQLLDNAGQGFLYFGEDLVIKSEYSLECTHIFGREVGGLSFLELLSATLDVQGLDEILKNIFREKDIKKTGTLMKLLPNEICLSEHFIKTEFKLLEEPNNQKILMVILSDVTEKKELERQMVQSEKMAALGGLVAGVAHEINTPVGVGVTAITHLERKFGEMVGLLLEKKLRKSDMEKYAESIKESAIIVKSNLDKASDLVRSFKRVSIDMSNEEKRLFNVKNYIHDILLSLSPKLKQKNPLVEIFCEESLQISSFPGAFTQILTNLIINSLNHGFSEKEVGKIIIQVTINEMELVLAYSDNGKGISPENLPKIFEPFFTTNRSSGGTGLGLHIVYNLVTQALGGQIHCLSEVGKETSFIIHLPLEPVGYDPRQ